MSEIQSPVDAPAITIEETVSAEGSLDDVVIIGPGQDQSSAAGTLLQTLLEIGKYMDPAS